MYHLAQAFAPPPKHGEVDGLTIRDADHAEDNKKSHEDVVAAEAWFKTNRNN